MVVVNCLENFIVFHNCSIMCLVRAAFVSYRRGLLIKYAIEHPPQSGRPKRLQAPENFLFSIPAGTHWEALARQLLCYFQFSER